MVRWLGRVANGEEYLLRSLLIRAVLSLGIVNLFCFPSLAQQPETPSSAPSEQQTPKNLEGQDTPGETRHGARQGKTKLEQETGTINDRILDVMPNYGTVENADRLPPISSSHKYRLATAGVLDYFTFPFIGGLAALDQANNSPKSWGQGTRSGR